MELHKLRPNDGSVKLKKRVGRGNSSGHGTTAGRGTKGQHSRSGFKRKFYFEGGQMPLARRVPKRGFRNVFSKKYAIVNIEQLNNFKEGEIIPPEILIETGMIKKILRGINILSKVEINKKLTIRALKFSNEAINNIESAGVKAEVI